MLASQNATLPDNRLLFPRAADRLAIDRELARLLADARQQVPSKPAVPTLDAEAFRAELAQFSFRTAMAMEPLLAWCVDRMQTGLVQITHPRYLGLFNPAPTHAAECADRIAAAFNPQLASATTSPAAVAIEAHVLRAVAERAGLSPRSEPAGNFTSGGSEANATAVICALTQASPEFHARGSRAFAGPPVFYISADSHLAWVKIAHQVGIGRLAARMIPTDGTGRMSIAALKQAIAADRRAGAVPFMLGATAGTTNAGMVDPLAECAEIARREHLWLHVDAAWGGGVIASEMHRHRLSGIEYADSVTIDAHKWFATTMGCGMILTPRPGILAQSFSVAANFMPSQAEIDPYVTSMQWSRRFLGLRLFLSLAAAGWAGHGAHVERSFLLIGQLSASLEARGWRRVNGEDALAVACLAPPAGSRPVREIAAAVLRSGKGWVSAARFEGRDVIRACANHGETTDNDIALMAEVLDDARYG